MAERDRITLSTLQECKRARRRISVLTCYDAAMARVMADAGVEVLLVGDTAAEVVLGLSSTRGAPAEFLIALTAAVRRGAPAAFVMADLPFVCRQSGDPASVADWARRFHEETGADAVKIEVTGSESKLVEAARAAGVPVVAHLGLLPQRIESEDGYRARGRDADSALVLIEEARTFERAGAQILLLEAVAAEVARVITESSPLPVIGCVSGPHCDGTVVVLHDMIGLTGGHRPRKVKVYEDLSAVLGRAFAAYVDDIHAGRFPADEHAIHMKPGQWERFQAGARAT